MAQMLTAKQVAEVKGCSPRYIKKIIQDRELDAIWQDGVLKGLTPSTPKLVKQISRMNGCKRVVAAPRGHIVFTGSRPVAGVGKYLH